MTEPSRIESDLIGPVELPLSALYGINTVRAVQNFAISGRPLHSERHFVRALALIKAAATRANVTLAVIPPDVGSAIVAAALEMEKGELDRWLVVDVFEGGGGTSINMNVNEVLANRALQMSRKAPGDYAAISPSDHVNRSQSTNDVVPSAIRIGAHLGLGHLVSSLHQLAAQLDQKQAEFATLLKLGRTCLQDAQPMTLGQAFGAYASAVHRCATELDRQRASLLTLPIGGTAIGTGFGSPPGYRELVLKHLSESIATPCSPPSDSFDAMSSADDYLRLAGELNCSAQAMGKLADDLMILSSGPHGGVAEISLPALQAGSSIMPGKVNPVAPMAVRQIAFACAGRYASISGACGVGQLEINPYEPLIAAELFEMIRLVTTASQLLSDCCVAGIRANSERMMSALLKSSAIATALLPALGYAETSRLVSEALAKNRPFLDLVVERGLMSREQGVEVIEKSTQAK